jgi:pyridinium-3,5-biscarboxylic acid mononucleotide sulfurtransferase
MIPELKNKYTKLKSILCELQSVVIGFSGGVDSSLLLKVASDVLGSNAVAVIGTSETYPQNEQREAVAIAKMIGIQPIEVATKEIDNPQYSKNPTDRCYHCKTELFGILSVIAKERGIRWVADGSIVDDLGDFRPGMKAKNEQNVRSPLLEAGLTKNDVRELSKELGLPNWDKPSFACLSSRFPYGYEITREALGKIDRAESFLRERGFKNLRVRNHDEKTARIEVGINEMHKFMDPKIRSEIVAFMKEIGFMYITLDLQGYRTGSMNEPFSSPSKIQSK